MKVLLNVSTANRGGALHLATLVIREALKERDDIQWHIVASPLAKQQISRFLDQTAQITVIDRTPARSLSRRRKLLEIERNWRPDCVFTPYGPAYVRFHAPHLLGVAVPWVAHPSKLAYRQLDFPFERLLFLADAKYKAKWFRRADAWWIESASAKSGLVHRLGLPEERITVIPNTCGSHFRETEPERKTIDQSSTIRLLYLTAPYKHKNLNMVPRTAKAIRDARPELSIQMVTTLPEDHVIFKRMARLADRLGVSSNIDNRGPIAVADAPKLFDECDVCFFPTVLEVFSATYPESMSRQIPIVTSDLPFARDACGNAALYFQPDDATDAAKAVLRVIDDQELASCLIANGVKRLAQLPTPKDKYDAYVSILRELVSFPTT